MAVKKKKMNAKMKRGKAKGKAIIGIAMAAIMLASVLVVMMPMGTAQVDPDVGRTVGAGGLIIIGERNVSFSDPVAGGIIQNAAIKGPTEDVGTVGKNSTYITFTNYLDTADTGLVNAEYYVINRNTGTVNYTVTFTEPCFILETKKTGTDDKVSTCVKGESIDFDLRTNLEIIDPSVNVTYKVTDAVGVPRDVEVTLDAPGNNRYTFTGTDKVGEYTVYVETNKSVCNGLDVSSSSIKFTVIELGISISADKTKIVKGTEVVLTGTTSPMAQIWVNVTSGVKENVIFVGGKGSYTGPDYTPTTALPGVCVTTEADGTYTVVAKITDIGVYEFEAKIGCFTDKVTVIVTAEAYLNASLSTDMVPPGDSFEISGNASLDYVEIVVISPKGGNGTGMDGLYGVTIYTVPTFITAEFNFYKKIKVDGGADTGNYTILPLSPGRDGIYGDSYYSYINSILDLDGEGPELGAIDVSNRTKEEIVAIIEDIIYAAGSDDFMWPGNIVVTQLDTFDTGEGSYPSIMGTHNGTITIQRMYTYPCTGTGGHSEYAGFYDQNGTKIGEGHWKGYQSGDYHYITFDAPFTLETGKTYNYTIKTGSYPQIIHKQTHTTLDGSLITCEEFIDANGKKYNNWIPAIRLD